MKKLCKIFDLKKKIYYNNIMVSNSIEYTREYYSKNKDKIKTCMSRKKYCDICNKYIRLNNFNRHCTCNKHKKNENLFCT